MSVRKWTCWVLVGAICYLTHSLPTRYPLHAQHVLAVRMSGEVPSESHVMGVRKCMSLLKSWLLQLTCKAVTEETLRNCLVVSHYSLLSPGTVKDLGTFWGWELGVMAHTLVLALRREIFVSSRLSLLHIMNTSPARATSWESVSKQWSKIK